MTSKLSQDSRSTEPVRVLLAEDSATVRWYLNDIISRQDNLEVIGEARNGEEAVALTARMRPDVVSMDINMPRLNGLDATRQIMATTPTPVVIVSGVVDDDLDLSFQALQSGALAVLPKPPSRQDEQFAMHERRLARTLLAMARVRVIRRGDTGPLRPVSPMELLVSPHRGSPRLLAIGASAGGPRALSKLLLSWSRPLPIPVVVVQHMADEFLPGMGRWLEKTTGHRVQLAVDGHELQPGVIHLSPGTVHLKVTRLGSRFWATLVTEKGSHRYHPSINVLFESVAVACGRDAIGVILTGMGDDGANGLLTMRQAGAHTFAQDENSSTVYGMPGAAVERGAVEQVLPLVDLPTAIAKLL